MSKKTTFKRIICLILIVIGLVGIILSIIYSASSGKSYTNEYKVYNEVKELTNLDEVREKLQNLKLEYTITSSKLTLSKYNHVSFSIKMDNTCLINSDKYMKNFEKLDDEDLSVATIHGIESAGKIIEKISISEGTILYTKMGNNYYVSNSNSYYVCILFTPLCGVPLALLLIDFSNKKKAKTKPKEQ